MAARTVDEHGALQACGNSDQRPFVTSLLDTKAIGTTEPITRISAQDT